MRFQHQYEARRYAINMNLKQVFARLEAIDYYSISAEYNIDDGDYPNVYMNTNDRASLKTDDALGFFANGTEVTETPTTLDKIAEHLFELLVEENEDLPLGDHGCYGTVYINTEGTEVRFEHTMRILTEENDYFSYEQEDYDIDFDPIDEVA